MSFKNKNPNWELLDLYASPDSEYNVTRLQNLPAVKWKMLNLNKMVKSKHEEAVGKLEKFLK